MIRVKLSEIFNELKVEHGLTYRFISDNTGLTHKQISAIVNATSGISLDRVCEVIEELFDVKIEVSYEDNF